MIKFILIATIWINTQHIVALEDIRSGCRVIVTNTNPGWNSTTTGIPDDRTCTAIMEEIYK